MWNNSERISMQRWQPCFAESKSAGREGWCAETKYFVDVGVEDQDMGAEGSVCTGERLKFGEAQRAQSMANDEVYFGLELCECRFQTLVSLP
jgi:hypothetical protein